MKREDLERYLGEMVEVIISDGSTYRGCLRKTGDQMFKDNPNLYIPKNHYFLTDTKDSKNCISCMFRSSHVKRLVKR